MKVNEILKESKNNAFIKQHIQWVADQLGIKQLPKIILLDKPIDTTFGQYDPDAKSIKLVTGGRHPVDVLRTLAHELTHHKQNLEDNLPDGAGETGTPQENEANSEAGVVLRNFSQENPEYLGLDKEEPLDEASYEGNLGAMEMMKFFQIAKPEEKSQLKSLIDNKQTEPAWDLIQQVLQTKLHPIDEHSDYAVADYYTEEDLRKIKMATLAVEDYARSLGIKFKFTKHFFSQLTLDRGMGYITHDMIMKTAAGIFKRGLRFFQGKPPKTSFAFMDNDSSVIFEVVKDDENAYAVRTIIRDTKWHGTSPLITV